MMIKPDERLAILNRIKAIGRKQKVFRISDCLVAHLGMHYAPDWEECLLSMVRKGQLTHDGKGDYSLEIP